MSDLSLKTFIQIANRKVTEAGDQLLSQAETAGRAGTPEEITSLLQRHRKLFDATFDAQLPGLAQHLKTRDPAVLKRLTHILFQRLEPTAPPATVPAAEEDFSALLAQKSVDEMSEEERSAISQKAESMDGAPPVEPSEVVGGVAPEENMLDEILAQTASDTGSPSPTPAEAPAGLAEEDMASLLAQKSVDEMSEEERANLDLTGASPKARPQTQADEPASPPADDILAMLEEKPAPAVQADEPASPPADDLLAMLEEKPAPAVQADEPASPPADDLLAMLEEKPAPAVQADEPASPPADDLLAMLEEKPAPAVQADEPASPPADDLLAMLGEEPSPATAELLAPVEEDSLGSPVAGAGIEDPALVLITDAGDARPSYSGQEPAMLHDDPSSAPDGLGGDALDALIDGAGEDHAAKDPLDELLASGTGAGEVSAARDGDAVALLGSAAEHQALRAVVPPPVASRAIEEEDESSDPLDHLLAQNEPPADHPSDEPLSFEAEIATHEDKAPAETLEDLIGQDAAKDHEDVVVDILAGSQEEHDAEVALCDIEERDDSVTNLIDVLSQNTDMQEVATPMSPAKETFKEEVADAGEDDESFVQLLSEVTGRQISHSELEVDATDDDGIITLSELIKDAEETLKQSHSRVVSEAYRLEQAGQLLYEGPDREEMRKAVEERVLAGKGEGLTLHKVITREVVKVETETKAIPIRISVDLGE